MITVDTVYLLYIAWDAYAGYAETQLEGVFEDQVDACNYPETQNWVYWQKTILPYEVKKKSNLNRIEDHAK